MHRKIIITGTTCTGKTTLGKKLSKELSIKQVDLDDLHFLPNWVEKEKSVFVHDVNSEIKKDNEWIITGSYQSLLKDTVWQESIQKVLGDDALDLDEMAQKKNRALGGTQLPQGLGDFFFEEDSPIHPDR